MLAAFVFVSFAVVLWLFFLSVHQNAIVKRQSEDCTLRAEVRKLARVVASLIDDDDDDDED